jgi:hypothetical protein
LWACCCACCCCSSSCCSNWAVVTMMRAPGHVVPRAEARRRGRDRRAGAGAAWFRADRTNGALQGCHVAHTGASLQA